MLRRCYSPDHPAFHYYGERGIEVCARWRGPAGYSNFVADLGEPPDGLTLERINNAGHYEPGNCRWATWKEQAANLGADRIPLTLTRCGVRPEPLDCPTCLVYIRVRNGWSEEDALTIPKLPRGGQIGHHNYRARSTTARRRLNLDNPPSVCPRTSRSTQTDHRAPSPVLRRGREPSRPQNEASWRFLEGG